jgi:hypothetical protein
MVILINAEKEIDKIQHSYIIKKTLNKLEIKGI